MKTEELKKAIAEKQAENWKKLVLLAKTATPDSGFNTAKSICDYIKDLEKKLDKFILQNDDEGEYI